MRKYLIILSALFGLLGIAADQLAFHIDDRITGLRDDREHMTEWLSHSNILLIETNLFRHRLHHSSSNEGILPGPYLENVKYDALHFMDYLLEDRSWVEHDEYSTLSQFNYSLLSEQKERLEELFSKKSLTSRDVQVILDITQAFPGGLMIEVLNVDDDIFSILEAEAENELKRQIYILLAIVSSLLSVLSVLVYARMSLRRTTS